MATFNPGRYTVLVTVTVFADSRRDAYRQIERALARKADGVTYVDAEDTQLEPFCANEAAHDCYEATDLAVAGTSLCAACLARVTDAEDRNAS